MSNFAKRSVLKLFSGNFLSKLLGAVREILVAALFGTGNVAGAYRISQTATLTPVDFFTKDALNSAFIPLYKRYHQESAHKADTLLWTLLVAFAVLAMGIGGLLWVFSWFWVETLAPGADTGMLAIASPMLKIMGLGVPFYLLSTLFAYLALAKGDVGPIAVRPVLQNICMIASVFVAFLSRDPLWLGWGFTLCYLMLLVWNIGRIVKKGAFPRADTWEWPLCHEVVGAFWRTLRPLLLMPVVQQGNIIMERVIASCISIAAISSLDYSRFITETIIFLVSIPVAFVGLSKWAELSADATREQMKDIVSLLLVITVPCSLFMGVNAHDIINVLYARGSFDQDSVTMAGNILAGTSIGLWAAVISYILIKALNSQLRNNLAMLIMVMGLLANVLINCLLYRQLGGYVLGVSNSVYTIITFIGGILAFRLCREIVSLCVCLAAACLIYTGLLVVVPEILTPWLSLIENGGISLIYWLAVILIVPSFRTIVCQQLGRKG